MSWVGVEARFFGTCAVILFILAALTSGVVVAFLLTVGTCCAMAAVVWALFDYFDHKWFGG